MAKRQILLAQFLLAIVLVGGLTIWILLAPRDDRETNNHVLCRYAAQALGLKGGSLSPGGGFGPVAKCWAYDPELDTTVEIYKFRLGFDVVGKEQ